MTVADRIGAFARTYRKWPASWPWTVREGDRDVLYAIWVIGNDYRNKTRYYGAFPHGLLERVLALFPDVGSAGVLHVFSGSLPPQGEATRLDVNEALQPDVVGSVYDVGRLFAGQPPFLLAIADPPYSKDDAAHYQTPAVNRGKATRALAEIVEPGGHLVWLDTCWPMHRKDQWLTVGRVLVQRSTNHRVRLLSIFERVR